MTTLASGVAVAAYGLPFRSELTFRRGIIDFPDASLTGSMDDNAMVTGEYRPARRRATRAKRWPHSGDVTHRFAPRAQCDDTSCATTSPTPGARAAR